MGPPNPTSGQQATITRRCVYNAEWLECRLTWSTFRPPANRLAFVKNKRKINAPRVKLKPLFQFTPKQIIWNLLYQRARARWPLLLFSRIFFFLLFIIIFSCRSSFIFPVFRTIIVSQVELKFAEYATSASNMSSFFTLSL